MGERVRASGARGSSGQGRVSSELHARRGRGEGGREQLGGGYAGTTGLTSRARNAEREKKAGAGAREAGLTGWAHGQRESEGAGARGKAAAPTGGAGRAVREGGGYAEGDRADRPGPLRRERRGGRRARERWAGWAERPRGRLGWAALPFSFILNCFSLFFYLFYLIQIQMSPKFKLDLLRIMHQTKVKSRVQHDATIHTPLGFNIIDYNYK